jgi:UDP-N-acetylglucosamine--N-acetylmuramyl-(pentapeptide) pyrophosphoryl-undecaprenol N-acetylglucosamine transferase
MEPNGKAKELKVIVAGGGTGGHLFPALAVVDALARRCPASVVFVGSERGIESRVVPKMGHVLHRLPVEGLRGRGLRGLASGAMRIPAAVAAAWRVLSDFAPDLAIGVGGYASVPAVIAAKLRRVPTVLLEQNAIPGMTNRLLGRIADRICASFPESLAYFPAGRAVETGNPVRVAPLAPAREDGDFAILVFGGSAGAHRLNEVGVEAAALLAADGQQVRIVHQTGTAEADDVRARYAERGLEADVRAFIDDMPAAYAAADLVVCRAGASTIAELTAFGKPSILVPYPYAADDHQRKNAESLSLRGAAVMILDREVTPERLAAEIRRLRDDPGRFAAMAEASRALGRPDAAERVADVCLSLVAERAQP